MKILSIMFAPIDCTLYMDFSHLSNGRLQEGQLTPVAVVDIRSRTETEHEYFSYNKTTPQLQNELGLNSWMIHGLGIAGAVSPIVFCHV